MQAVVCLSPRNSVPNVNTLDLFLRENLSVLPFASFAFDLHIQGLAKICGSHTESWMIRIAASFQESQPCLCGASVSSAASTYTIHWLLPHNLCCPTPITSTIANTRNRNSSANNPAATAHPRRRRMSTSDPQHPLSSPQSSYRNPHGSTVPPLYPTAQHLPP